MTVPFAALAQAEPDSARVVVYAGVGGGVGWADGSSEADYTGSTLVFVRVFAEAELALEYETDIGEVVAGAAPGEPEDQWSKMGVAYRGETLGGAVFAVRAGDFAVAPAYGLEAVGLLAIGGAEDPWGSFVRIVYTNEESQGVRVGAFMRLN